MANWFQKMVTSQDGKATAQVRKLYSTETQKRLSQLKHNTWTTLGSKNLHLVVRTPDGEDKKEWIALNLMDFFNEISLLAELATSHEDAEQFKAPGKGFPPGYIYKWKEAKGKKPLVVSGPEYIDYCLAYIEAIVNDNTIFPETDEVEFPENYEDVCKDLYVKMFRIFAILYGAFLDTFKTMEINQNLNTSFKHFVYFGFCHNLMPSDKELTPLLRKVQEFKTQYEEATTTESMV